MELKIKIIKQLLWKFQKIRNNFKIWILRYNVNLEIPYSNKIRKGCHIKTNFGGKIILGENNELLFGVCLMTYGGSIIIGNDCSINPYTLIYGHGKGVRIGNKVLIAGHTTIIPANHN